MQLLNWSHVKHTIIHSSHLIDSCCQCYLPSYLRCLFEWWSNLVLGGISDKHRSTETPSIKFPSPPLPVGGDINTASQFFTKFNTTSCCHTLISHLDLQSLWERLKSSEHCIYLFCFLQQEDKMTVFMWLKNSNCAFCDFIGSIEISLEIYVKWS